MVLKADLGIQPPPWRLRDHLGVEEIEARGLRGLQEIEAGRY